MTEALHTNNLRYLKPCLKATAEAELDLLIKRERYKPPFDCSISRFLPESLQMPPLPLSLRFAEYAGSKMLWSFLYPALPKVIVDYWILLVFLVKLVLLILFATVYDGSTLHQVTISFLVIALVLSMVDAYLYYIEEGSLFEAVNWCRRTCSHNSSSPRCSCGCYAHSRFPAMKDSPGNLLPKPAQGWLITRLEITRTIISQIILHILLLTFLIVFATSRPYTSVTTTNNIIYAVFIIGIILYVFAVYFMRFALLVSAIVSLKRLPKTTNNDYLKFMNRIAFIIAGNIVYLAALVYMVATRLRWDTCVDSTGAVTSINYQAPLVYIMIASSLLPMLSLAIYFLINYQTVKSMYTAFYIDVTSAITSTAFKGMLDLPEDEATQIQAVDIALKENQVKVREDYEEFLFSVTFLQRLTWLVTNPMVILATSFYLLLVTLVFVAMAAGFSACDGNTERIIFDDTSATVAFFIGLTTVVVTNTAVILVGLLSLFVLGLIAALLVIIPIVALIFSPVIFVAVFVYLSTKEKRSTVV